MFFILKQKHKINLFCFLHFNSLLNMNSKELLCDPLSIHSTYYALQLHHMASYINTVYDSSKRIKTQPFRWSDHGRGKAGHIVYGWIYDTLWQHHIIYMSPISPTTPVSVRGRPLWTTLWVESSEILNCFSGNYIPSENWLKKLIWPTLHREMSNCLLEILHIIFVLLCKIWIFTQFWKHLTAF